MRDQTVAVLTPHQHIPVKKSTSQQREHILMNKTQVLSAAELWCNRLISGLFSPQLKLWCNFKFFLCCWMSCTTLETVLL